MIRMSQLQFHALQKAALVLKWIMHKMDLGQSGVEQQLVYTAMKLLESKLAKMHKLHRRGEARTPTSWTQHLRFKHFFRI